MFKMVLLSTGFFSVCVPYHNISETAGTEKKLKIVNINNYLALSNDQKHHLTL